MYVRRNKKCNICTASNNSINKALNEYIDNCETKNVNKTPDNIKIDIFNEYMNIYRELAITRAEKLKKRDAYIKVIAKIWKNIK